MATLGELATSVSKRLLDPLFTSVSKPDVVAAINSSVKYWKVRRFWFNEAQNPAGNLTIGSEIIPAFTNYLAPAYKDDGFYITYSNQRWPLAKIDQTAFDAMFLSNGNGMPSYYTRTGNGYQIYPIPDRAYSVSGRFIKDYPDLVDDTDSNDFTVYADRLILLWTLRNLQAEIRQDEKMMSYYENSAMDEYKNLGVLTGKINATGTLTQHSLL